MNKAFHSISNERRPQTISYSITLIESSPNVQNRDSEGFAIRTSLEIRT